jgi:uncharacterized protein YqeY
MIKNQLENDLHVAMRNNEEIRKNTLRMLLSSIKLMEIDKHSDLTDQEIIAVVQKEVKMRNETLQELKTSGRSDLIEKAKNEIIILNEYLPVQLSNDELNELVKQAISETGASGIKDMGRVMKVLFPIINARASSERVSNAVKDSLNLM